MTSFALLSNKLLSDEVIVWGDNVLLQVSYVTAVALVTAAAVRRSPAERDGGCIGLALP